MTGAGANWLDMIKKYQAHNCAAVDAYKSAANYDDPCSEPFTVMPRLELLNLRNGLDSTGICTILKFVVRELNFQFN